VSVRVGRWPGEGALGSTSHSFFFCPEPLSLYTQILGAGSGGRVRGRQGDFLTWPGFDMGLSPFSPGLFITPQGDY
jgi:hypothetical protein